MNEKEQSDIEDKRWSDMIAADLKMVEFARQELLEGNLLQAKSIADSLSKTYDQNFPDFPASFKAKLEQLSVSINLLQQQCRQRVTPKKKALPESDEN